VIRTECNIVLLIENEEIAALWGVEVLVAVDFGDVDIEVTFWSKLSVGVGEAEACIMISKIF
jgi:hypothetical protein